MIDNEKPSALFTVEFIRHQFTSIVGKTLTIIDASIQDPVQRKAVKDLIKHQIYSQLQWVVEYSLNENVDGVALSGVIFRKKCGCNGVETKCSNCA